MYFLLNLSNETFQEFELAVEVEDISASNGRQIDYSTIMIKVQDVNDNSPQFKQKTYKASVTENTLSGTNIINIIAIDTDANRSIYYKLEGKREIIKLVKIDKNSGQISVGGKIDREKLQWLNFTVRATDNGIPPQWSYADVSIEVLDENDNSPVFMKHDSNISVSEDTPVGHIISKITATDKDEGEYGRVTYFLDNHSGSSKFQIDPDTGTIVEQNNA